MKNNLFFNGIFFLISFLGKAQVSEYRDVKNFTAIDASSGIHLVFSQSEKFSVKIVTDNKEKLKYFITKLEGGTLKIYIDNTPKKNFNIQTLDVYISAPHLNKINVTAGTKFKIKNTLKEDNLDIYLSAGVTFEGSLDVKNTTTISLNSGVMFNANINTVNLYLKAKDGSNAIITGKYKNTDFKVDKTSYMDLSHFHYK